MKFLLIVHVNVILESIHAINLSFLPNIAFSTKTKNLVRDQFNYLVRASLVIIE